MDEALATAPAMEIIQALFIGHTSGTGDVFHGAYVHSYLTSPAMNCEEHFCFARATAAYKIQHLGNEAGLPTLAEIAPVKCEFEVLS